MSHRIERATVEINTDYTGQEVYATGKWKQWTVSRLLEPIEEIFDQFSSDDTIIRIDKLNIELDLNGIDPDQQLPESIFISLRNSLKSQIESALDQGADVYPVREKYLAGLVLKFIRSGFIETKQTAQSWAELRNAFKESLFDDPSILRQTLEIAQVKDAFGRLVHVIGLTGVRRLLLSLLNDPDAQNKFQAIVAMIANEKGIFKEAQVDQIYRFVFSIEGLPDISLDSLLIFVLRKFSAHRIDKIDLISLQDRYPSIKQVLDDAFSEVAAATKPEIHIEPRINDDGEKRAAQVQEEHIAPGVSIPSNNAGVVILAPFLFRFFDKLGVVDQEKRLKDSDRAVMLLYHLVTGRREGHEWEMPILKLICGRKIAQTCRTEIILNTEEETECENLLQEVLQHWKKLGNTSIEGLRSTFLQRSGTIIDAPDHWKLIIPERAEDILLKYAPWSYTTVYLPWMVKPIITDW